MSETKKIPVCRMDYGYMTKMLCSLPSDTLVTIKLTYIERDQELMARDFPREGRRFTNLTSGTEWFMTEAGLERLGVEALTIHTFTVEQA
jgi:hypothetical protein